MPYAARYFEVDPLAPYKNRGAGWYYNRGNNYFAKLNKKTQRFLYKRVNQIYNF